MLKKYFEEEKYNELKDNDNLLYKALEIVTSLFINDVDRGGMPYLLHIMYVYRHVSTYDEKVVALLHDVLEDKDVSEKDLLEVGFPKSIVDDVSSLTRVRPMEYSDYIEELIKKGSICALHVKQVDLENNMDISRINNPTIKDYQRIEKRYTPAYEKISNRLKEMEK